MRKICLLALFLLIFFFSFNISFAYEVSPTLTSKVDYELPYPGLLPDHPLYFLKIIRDKTVSFLISDPLKKSEFNLLQADKRLNAGIYLFQKKKFALSLSTVSKAENYFHEALEKLEEAKRQGYEVESIKGRMIESAKKHQQELKLLSQQSDKNFKNFFRKESERAGSFVSRLSN